eukprot:m.61909 g.61909  ORF g.61909 m.61909 type:complete len:2120 (+) comp19316_c0_seq1:250-6609(+)
MPQLPRKQVGLYHPDLEHDACGVGFICNIDGKECTQTVSDALTILERLDHRSACCDAQTGDGSGILMQIPFEFFHEEMKKNYGVTLPERGRYAIGQHFWSKDDEVRQLCKDQLVAEMKRMGLSLIAWREVPVNRDNIGQVALEVEPHIEQSFWVINNPKATDQNAMLELKLYIARKRFQRVIEKLVQDKLQVELLPWQFHFASLSSRTIVYKGQLTPAQVSSYFLDLRHPKLATRMAMVHSRFSTNTMPSWDRAHPQRTMCHNGEFNTLQGNINWTKARQGLLGGRHLDLSEDEIAEILPVIDPAQSDSGTFNSVLELLIVCGRPVPEAMMMMIPEAWQKDKQMSQKKKDFYRYMSCLMEPWDGPALVAFTDGRYLGATLDRNGLRPGRFYVTKDNRLIMSSEFGVVDVPDNEVLRKGRLQPGRMLMVDFDQRRLVEDSELKNRFVTANPYGQWLKENALTIESLGDVAKANATLGNVAMKDLIPGMSAAGWTSEAVELLLIPMFQNSVEALGSMGNDTPLACISDRPRLPYEYFKQRFAQVTNPPLDSIRESIVMSVSCFVGPERDISETTPDHARRLELVSPMLTVQQLQVLIDSKNPEWRAQVLDTTFDPVKSETLETTIRRLCAEASAAVDAGCTIIVLSDSRASQERVAVSSLLSLAAVHHHLIRTMQRLRVALVIEGQDIREVHHFCLLVGYGADGICTTMAMKVIAAKREELAIRQAEEEQSEGQEPKPFLSVEQCVAHYFKALEKGMLKVMAKMGISTIQSYKGAQIFEAIGLSSEVIDLCFCGTKSQVSGASLDTLNQNHLVMHQRAYPSRVTKLVNDSMLPNPGDYHYRNVAGSERHLNDPASIAKLQEAARNDSAQAYADYARMVNDLNQHCTLRGLLSFKKGQPIDISEVEPAKDIVKRFCTGAMSFGSISIEAHTTLARAMNRIGGKSNTGEGGETMDRLKATRPDGSNPLRSAIKQVASARFGVTSMYLTNAEELQIKMAQGAKPGEGGELPGHKVNKAIAHVRNSTPGVGLISPPPHHDIYSIEDLKELIYDLKNSNPQARVSVKLVSETGVGIVAAGVVKAHADHVLISGHDGGTGASRWTSIKHAGLPWEIGLAETQQTLVLNDLRRRVVVQTDGQLKTGRDVAVAALLGAEEFGFATAPLIAMGCIMMRKCHLNTCPVGIATQDEELRKKFAGEPEHVLNFFFLLAEEVRKYMASMGFRTMNEMIGRADMLEPNTELLKNNLNTAGLDFTALLTPAKELRANVPVTCVEEQNHFLDLALDQEIMRLAEASLQLPPRPSYFELDIGNVNRCVGTMLSHRMTKLFGAEELPESLVHVMLHGSAGNSFGAWVRDGITLELEGDSNDYVGKGLCGGRLVLYPPRDSLFVPEDNIITGNVALYGATSGEVYFRGCAGERFAVRNSGAIAICEGIGDHGCEYMTGGRVVILGPTGRNFAAGMSGGFAYVYDPKNQFEPNCNKELVRLDRVTSEEDEEELRVIVQQHRRFTKSSVARTLLNDWKKHVGYFVKVVPTAYERALKQLRSEEGEHAAKTLVRGLSSTINIPPAKRTRRHSPPSNDMEDYGLLASKTNGHTNGNGIHSRDSGLSLGSRNGHNNTTASMSLDSSPAGSPPPARQIVVAKPIKKRGFIEYERGAVSYRPATARVQDWKELLLEPEKKQLKTQAARCMDCGVPFCHQAKTGCPLNNKIPEWNQLVYEGKWKEALASLLSTNNFPEFTGRVCPAPCEGACVLGIIEKPVTIKNIECSIIDRAFKEGWMVPRIPEQRTGKTIAIIGSGPAGLAAADQLNQAGHLVTVFERADRIGGLMMYGVPNMKCDKEDVVQRRVNLMAKEGIIFKTNVEIGTTMPVSDLTDKFSAVLLACGATMPRNLPIPGRELKNIHFAMDFLRQNTKSLLDSEHKDGKYINVKGKRVIVIGGGDTGNDCIGTAMRHGASSVINFELMPQPPSERGPNNPWPQWPAIYRVDYGHEEVMSKTGKDPREFCVLSTEFVGDDQGQVRAIKTVQVEWEGRKFEKVPGTEREFLVDYVFLAMGFLGPEQKIGQDLKVETDQRSNFKAEYGKFNTSVPGVFAAGDCRRGQSLVVWAIAEGRGAAREIDTYLCGSSTLP